MESEKIGIDGLIYKAEIETDTENKHGYQWDWGEGCGMNWDCHTYTTI